MDDPPNVRGPQGMKESLLPAQKSSSIRKTRQTYSTRPQTLPHRGAVLKTKRFALHAAALCLLGLPLYATNLLTNPGFETGDFSGWNVLPNTPTYGVAVAGTDIPGTVFGPMSVIVNSGNYAAYALVCDGSVAGNCMPSGDPGDNLTLEQTVDLVAGQTYHIGFWIGNPITTGLGDSSAITVDGVPLSNFNAPDIGQGYSLVDGTFTASSSGPATVSYFLEGSGDGDAGISFDDFFVNSSVPEPSSLWLLGSGLLGAAGILRSKLVQ
jgi:hypothetical protein